MDTKKEKLKPIFNEAALGKKETSKKGDVPKPEPKPNFRKPDNPNNPKGRGRKPDHPKL